MSVHDKSMKFVPNLLSLFAFFFLFDPDVSADVGTLERTSPFFVNSEEFLVILTLTLEENLQFPFLSSMNH